MDARKIVPTVAVHKKSVLTTTLSGATFSYASSRPIILK